MRQGVSPDGQREEEPGFAIAALQEADILPIEASGVPLCTWAEMDRYTKLLSYYQMLDEISRRHSAPAASVVRIEFAHFMSRVILGNAPPLRVAFVRRRHAMTHCRAARFSRRANTSPKPTEHQRGRQRKPMTVAAANHRENAEVLFATPEIV